MSLKTRITSDRSLVSLVRRAVTEYAKMRGGFNDDALDDIELAVGEALANAVEHGHRGGGWISASCDCENDAFNVTIRDNGPRFDHAKRMPATPPAFSLRGFGLNIMRGAMDNVRFQRGGRSVTMTKQQTHA